MTDLKKAFIEFSGARYKLQNAQRAFDKVVAGRLVDESSFSLTVLSTTTINVVKASRGELVAFVELQKQMTQAWSQC